MHTKFRWGGASFPSVLGRIHMNPDPEGAGGGGSPQDQGDGQADAGSSAAQQQPDQQTALANQRAEGPGGSQQVAAPNQGGGGDGWTSLRDAIQSNYGYTLPDGISDDRSALDFLVRSARQQHDERHYAELGRMLEPRASEFLGQGQGRPGPQQQPEQRPEWQPPEFDPRWANLVEFDRGSGLYVAKGPGVPQSIVQSVNEYADWKQRYDANPAAIITKLVESVATRIANETYQAQMSQFGNTQAVSRITQDLSTWAYARDPQTGAVIRGWDNQVVLSPQGQQYRSALTVLAQSGVTDPARQDMLARQMIGYQADWSNPGGAQSQATNRGNGGGAKPPANQGRARNQPNNGSYASMNAGEKQNSPANPPYHPTGSYNLERKLAERFEQAGLTDADFRD